MIYQQVTLGNNFANRPKEAPTIGDQVVIGAGAKVVGGVTIGERAVIGANSVVSKDVPPDSVAVGVPARILRLNDRDAAKVARTGAVPERAAAGLGVRGLLRVVLDQAFQLVGRAC